MPSVFFDRYQKGENQMGILIQGGRVVDAPQFCSITCLLVA